MLHRTLDELDPLTCASFLKAATDTDQARNLTLIIRPRRLQTNF